MWSGFAQVRLLRRKIASHGHALSIDTVASKGYRLSIRRSPSEEAPHASTWSHPRSVCGMAAALPGW